MNSTMIGFMKKALTLGCLALALTGTGRVASACSVWYQDAYDDGTWVYSNMTVIQQMYGDSIRAYERLGALDNRYTSQDTGDQIVNQVVAWADLPINLTDGAYTAEGEAYENDVQEGSQQQQHTVNPFVEITQTQFAPSPPTLGHAGPPTGTFTVSAATSSNCSGSVTVNAAMAYPTNMDIKISIGPPDGDGSQQTYTASGSHMFPGGGTHQFAYSLATGSNNQVSAPNNGANVTAYLYSYPANCSPVNVPGVPLVQVFTVN
jgi:hypothetical protein